jgi:hypothetical protein
MKKPLRVRETAVVTKMVTAARRLNVDRAAMHIRERPARST